MKERDIITEEEKDRQRKKGKDNQIMGYYRERKILYIVKERERQ